MRAFLRRHCYSVILLCCFLVLFANQGLPATSFNVYQTYLVELPGVGAVGGSLVLTVRAFVSLLVMVFVASFYRRVDARYGVIAATLATAAGFTIYGLFPTLPGLIAGSVLTGVGYGLGGMVATTLILGKWFTGSIGKAAGFAGMGSGVASFVVPTVAAEVIERSGLSTAFFLEAGLACALTVVFALFLHSDPAQMGLEPYAVPPRPARADRREGEVEGGATAAIAASAPSPAANDGARCRRRSCRRIARADLSRRDKRLMMAAMVLMGGVAITGFGYFSVLLTSSGVNPIAAAVITSVGGACLAVGKLACGWVVDRWGTRVGTVSFFAILLVGLALCIGMGSGSPSEGFFAAVAYCTGIAIATTGIAVWSLELSSAAATTKTIRDFNLAYAAGGFLFNMVPGPLYALTGTYTVTYVLLAAFALASAVIVVSIYTRRAKADKA